MKVNIGRAVKSIGDVSFYQPLYEAIVNSFQANADVVKLSFSRGNDYVVGYTIEDNGEGYTNGNIESYLELWSEHKIKMGALGSGRILCLKVFDNILTKSQTIDHFDKNGKNELAQYVEMDFNRDFEANTVEDVNPTKMPSDKSYTITEFKNINADYSSVYEKEKEPFNLDKIKENIFIKLLPMFIRFNREQKDFSISINDEIWLEHTNLKRQFEEHDFEEESFIISKDLAIYNKGYEDLEDKKDFKFTLLYRIKEDKKNELEQFYGASDRFIKKFTKGVRLENLPKNQSGIFCLTSPYFDDSVTDSRADFDINENNPSKKRPIVFTEIKDQLKKTLNEILLKKFPETEKEFTGRKEVVVEKFPHLSRYIKNIDSLTMSESDMLKQAEKEFHAEKKLAREEVEKFTKKIKEDKNFDEKAYEEITRHFTQVGREQLADYIGYRQTIIDMLLEIHDETSKDMKRFNEKDIHDLFMPMSDTSDTLFTYANNVWIFDDKFMSYNYAASDKTIAKIVKDVTGDDSLVPKHHKNQEPDLVMFYSNPEHEYKDILLIEFKRLNNVLSEKKKAITQLQDYPMYIRKNIDKVRSIFSYTIIDIDEPFREWLTDSQDFDEYAFGDDDDKVSAYYRYFDKVKSHVNIVSFSQILGDANKRNKVFLDILIQNFKA